MSEQDALWLLRHIEKAQANSEFCRLTVHIHAGKIMHVEKTETFKPPKAGRMLRETGN